MIDHIYGWPFLGLLLPAWRDDVPNFVRKLWCNCLQRSRWAFPVHNVPDNATKVATMGKRSFASIELKHPSEKQITMKCSGASTSRETIAKLYTSLRVVTQLLSSTAALDVSPSTSWPPYMTSGAIHLALSRLSMVQSGGAGMAPVRISVKRGTPSLVTTMLA